MNKSELVEALDGTNITITRKNHFGEKTVYFNGTLSEYLKDRKIKITKSKGDLPTYRIVDDYGSSRSVYKVLVISAHFFLIDLVSYHFISLGGKYKISIASLRYSKTITLNW